jgi:hypothetical protein
MMDRSKSEASAKQGAGVLRVDGHLGAALMMSMMSSVLAVLVLSGVCAAKELPEAPSAVAAGEAFIVEATLPTSTSKLVEKTKVVDGKFLSLAVIATGSTFADSYTTLFAQENWLAGKKGVCNMEVQSAYLYGKHPTVGRAYAVASMKSAGAVVAAYYMRKHHNKFWSLPLVANSIVSLQGVTQNMMACN